MRLTVYKGHPGENWNGITKYLEGPFPEVTLYCVGSKRVMLAK